MPNKSERVKNWKSDSIASQRSKMRKNYMGGPAIGPGIWALYKKYFTSTTKNKKNPKVLILGATPELRDMVLKQDYNLTTVDMSPEMIEKMTGLMKYQNDPKEKIVQVDWLNLKPIKAGSVDLVMGDAVSANIVLAKQNQFFNEIKRVLKPQGHVLIRELVVLPEKKIRPPEEIVKEWRREKRHWFDLFFELHVYSTLSYDQTTKTRSMEKLFSGIKIAYEQGVLNEKEFKALWPWKGNLVHTILPQKEFEEIFSRHFELLPIEKATDYNFCNFFYLFLGKAKK